MADTGADGLIPLDAAAACLWPVSATDQRLRLRIVRSPPSAEQLAWLAQRGGRSTILDPTGKGDAQLLFARVGRHEGWADAEEVRREFGKVDCPLGASMRALSVQLERAA